MSESSRSPLCAADASAAFDPDGPEPDLHPLPPDRAYRARTDPTAPDRTRASRRRPLARSLALLALPAVALFAACDEGSAPLEPESGAVAVEREASLSAPTLPGTVADLDVVSAAGGTVVLAFTEVGDGAGGAAAYDVRYAPTPMGWGWGRAASVGDGTCATPLRGASPGSRRECTVEGLEIGASYDFRLVAYRGTLDVDAVFGGLSNVATGTLRTRNVPPKAEASVVCEDRFCRFDGSASEDPDGSIASWEWRFGDGTRGRGRSVKHEYGSAGEYTATLTVTDDAGGADTTRLAVGVTDPPVPAGDPGTVSDLRVASTTPTSAVLTFTQVDDGTGDPAAYDIRYASSPIGWGWGSATSVSSGTCSSPVRGSSVGSGTRCTVEGLSPGVAYDFQAVAFRGTLGVDAVFGGLSNVATGTTDERSEPDGDDGADGGTKDEPSGESLAHECRSPAAEWIWCDDFDRNRLDSYFEHVTDGGSFVRASSVGVEGSSGMRARWSAGQVSAGSLKLAFGRTPQRSFRPVDGGTDDHREIYWRFYVRNQDGWTGGGGAKLSRATIFASSTSWAQAMIAHVWSGSGSDRDYLVVDPASGTDPAGNLVTTKYNDFANLRWLGSDRGSTPLFADDRVGRWYCVEARVRLNGRGSANGEFQLWIDGDLDAERRGLDWVGRYDDYGINAIFLENYWNSGAPQAQERYIDNFVVSTERIGCGGS